MHEQHHRAGLPLCEKHPQETDLPRFNDLVRQRGLAYRKHGRTPYEELRYAVPSGSTCSQPREYVSWLRKMADVEVDCISGHLDLPHTRRIIIQNETIKPRVTICYLQNTSQARIHSTLCAEF